MDIIFSSLCLKINVFVIFIIKKNQFRAIADIDTLKTAENGKLVTDLIREEIGKLGENITISRAQLILAPSDVQLFGYAHPKRLFQFSTEFTCRLKLFFYRYIAGQFHWSIVFVKKVQTQYAWEDMYPLLA